MNLKHRIECFAELGFLLEKASRDEVSEKYPEISKRLIFAINSVQQTNAWFIEEYVRLAYKNIGGMLNMSVLQKWLAAYKELECDETVPQTVAVIMAGNIPLVGFHDFLSVLISGHKILIKESSKDPLIHEVANALCVIEPDFERFISFVNGKLSNFDAVIATGSNNTKRYFEYYFSKYPSIIRGHRSSVAVVLGNESKEDLEKLADDVFLYFGMGCRNVSKIFIPNHYPVRNIIEAFEKYTPILSNHHKYFNNYEYYKSIYLVNKTPFFDSGCFMMKFDNLIVSPLSVVYLEEYSTEDFLIKSLEVMSDSLQCVVSQSEKYSSVRLGDAQKPGLDDYADGVDVLKFLIDLKKAM
jgi:hypothetical protein